MSQVSQVHYDKPQSHQGSSTGGTLQTRYVIPGGRQIISSSIKILDLKINPNRSCKFPALVGAYSTIKRVQIRLNSKEVDVWTAKSVLPYLISMFGDNEYNKGMLSQVAMTGNNVVYDSNSKLLTLNRPNVDDRTATLNLSVYSDLLNKIGIINMPMEIIIDWETLPTNFLLSNGGGAVDTFNILAPYLSYETLSAYEKAQPAQVEYTQWIEDQWSVPSIADNTQQQYEIRSNAFNNKYVHRLMLTNVPSSIVNNAPSADLVQLYGIFGSYMSVPMKQEIFNIARDGMNLLTFRNVSNDAVKLSVAHDTWGQGLFVTNAHMHTNASVLLDLSGSPLNGYASYGCCEISDFVRKELQITYRRTSDDNGDYPSLGAQLVVAAVAEVKVVLDGDEKVYVGM
jgi:hypothetical protein